MIKLVRNHHRFVNGLAVSAYGLCNLLLLLAISLRTVFMEISLNADTTVLMGMYLVILYHPKGPQTKVGP